jgi:hypothetical protein
MYPLTKQEESICETLFAHVAAVNAINESEAGQKFEQVEDLVPFIEKLLNKNGPSSFTPRMVGIHLHICRQPQHDRLVNDLAVISYLLSA